MCRPLLLCLVIILLVTPGPPGKTMGAAAQPIHLPADRRTEVIVFDSRGGMQRRKSGEPLLTIRADGTAILGDPWGMGQRTQGQVSPGRLQALVDFIAVENGFFGLDSAQIESEVREVREKQGGLSVFVDAGVTVIRVNLIDRSHEVSYYALDLAASQFPSVESLQRLAAVARRLKQEMSWIRVGGKEGVIAELELANRHLHLRYPEAEPLTSDHLESAVSLADGERLVHFARRERDGDGRLVRFVEVQIRHPVSGEPAVAVTAKLH
jgi:hypothetical protein